MLPGVERGWQARGGPGGSRAVLSRFSRARLFAAPWTGPPRLFCPWDSRGKILERVAIPSSGGSSCPVMEPQPPASPALAGGLSTTRPPGKPCLVPDAYSFVSFLSQDFQWQALRGRPVRAKPLLVGEPSWLSSTSSETLPLGTNYSTRGGFF